MLKSLFIKNYVLIEQLDIDFANGFHAFTGETGAGKSIIVGALSLIIGHRADYSVIRNKEKKCEISALFDISNNRAVKKWLDNQDIEHNDEIECRRVISSDGRSKSWLNTRPCNNSTLKKLGSLLVQIHGQHDQIKLNNSQYQLSIIDDALGEQSLLNTTAQLAKDYFEVEDQLKKLELAGALSESESQLLHYQFDELQQLNLSENELDHLHEQQKSLTAAVQNLQQMDHSMSLLTGNNNGQNISQSIADVISSLSGVEGVSLNEVLSMLDEVSINLNEIESQLQQAYESVEVNPEKLHEIETRLDHIYQTARKHQVNAESLYQHQQDLAEKLELSDGQKAKREQLLQDKQSIKQKYEKCSQKLSITRSKTAKSFARKVTDVIQKMGLNKAEFLVRIEHNAEQPIHKLGQDHCEFQVIMNVGQAPQKMSATASGGELSRIALAIEICKKQDLQSNSFVFDEVDSGIGGAVAETVGQLMRNLSENQQVFAVTHLPHVAGLAHHHYLVSKMENKGQTQSSVQQLDEKQRVDELARMLGGSTITETTLEQAKHFMQLP